MEVGKCSDIRRDGKGKKERKRKVELTKGMEIRLRGEREWKEGRKRKEEKCRRGKERKGRKGRAKRGREWRGVQIGKRKTIAH